MAYQIAQAYDENKNLVPLYVLTDGEVPEVSPGFATMVSGIDVSNRTSTINVIITQTSSNPAGGVADSQINESTINWVSDKVIVRIYNNSDFSLTVGGYVGFKLSNVGPYSININSIAISSKSNVDIDIGHLSYNDDYGMDNMSAVFTVNRNN